MKAKIKERSRAIALRKKGLSIKEIARRLKCSPSSVCLWVKAVKLTSEQVKNLASMSHGGRKHLLATRALQKKCAAIREEWREVGRRRARLGCWRHAMACSLYWAEGTKKRNHVSLANTDPEMIRFFYDFLVREFALKPKIEFSYHQDEGNSPEPIARRFWAKHLGVPVRSVSSFANKDKRARTGLRKNRHANGMCIISLSSTEVAQHIYGALEVYGNIFICK